MQQPGVEGSQSRHVSEHIMGDDDDDDVGWGLAEAEIKGLCGIMCIVHLYNIVDFIFSLKR